LNLSPDVLKAREVVNVEITDPIDQAKYKAEEDPTLFVSSKTGRGALKPGWNVCPFFFFSSSSPFTIH